MSDKPDRQLLLAEQRRTTAKIDDNAKQLDAAFGRLLRVDIAATSALRAITSATGTQSTIAEAFAGVLEQPKRAARMPRSGDEHARIVAEANRRMRNGESLRGMARRLVQAKFTDLDERTVRGVLKAHRARIGSSALLADT